VKLQTSGTARAAAAGVSKPSRPKPAKKTDGTPRGKPGAKATGAAGPLRAPKAPAAKPAAKGKSSAPQKAKKIKDSDAPLLESPRDKERRALALSAAELAIESALDKKAVGPILIDVSTQASYTDFIGVVSGRSDRQVEAIADHVSVTMKKAGFTLVGREGTNNGRWTLLDFGDMILHIFYHPVREVYDIEGLWVGAVRVPLKNVPPEALHFQGDALYAPS
jgi:ribosome-associated protein